MNAPMPAAAEPRSEMAERRSLMLWDLAEIGMNLAREIEQRAMDEAAPRSEVADLALAFSRVARAVRMTVALEARLAEPPREPRAPRAPKSAVNDNAAWAPPTPEFIERTRATVRKAIVRDIVEQTIAAEAPERGEGYDAERLLADLDERLEDEDDYVDFALLSLVELVERICRDLGVRFDPSLLEDDDWYPLPPTAGPFVRQERYMGRPEPPDPSSAPPGERRDPDDKAKAWPGSSP